MDPMMAMMQGLGPDPTMGGGQPQGPPVGPDGFPVGGSMPPMGDGDDPSMGGSDLLQALQGSMGGGDPYGVGPMDPSQGFQGIGTGDPNMGIEQLLQMLALGQGGVGGAPGGGGGLVDPGMNPSMGGMVGMGGGYWVGFDCFPISGDSAMSISQKLKNAIKTAMIEPGATAEIVSILNNVKPIVDAVPSAAIVPVVVTYTASNPTAATGAITIAAGATPTAVELLSYCTELKANIVALNAVLHAKGLTL
jgi:hypothetical protein